MTLYNGHTIETDHTGNLLKIDGNDVLKYWHASRVDDAVEWACLVIDQEQDPYPGDDDYGLEGVIITM